MANKEFTLPIKGFSLGVPPHLQPPATTGYINNMFPKGQLEQWIRLEQRDGLDKAFDEQVGGDTAPTIFILSVTTVD
jgi:hypothetical protein